MGLVHEARSVLLPGSPGSPMSDRSAVQAMLAVTLASTPISSE